MKDWNVSSTRVLLILFFAVLAIGLFSQHAQAQVFYGSVVGTVEDATGAVVPKAAITIINKGTGLTREAAADDSGRYSLLNVLPGSYDLKVSASGFRPFVQTEVVVSINTVTRVDVKLEVGAVTESVTVSGSAALLTTEKADVHSELTSQTMTNVPLPNIYRNYQALLNLVPGATPAQFQNAVVDTPGRALRTRINGTNPNTNTTMVDGAVNIYIWLPHHTVYVQPVESIDTVNISTGSFDAEQGMAGGAAITVATKSGTNDIHGSAFWYHNNQHLNSKPYFYTQANLNKNILNQGGGTVGGPIKKNKLFYFGSLERTMERGGFSGNYSTPPADFRNGDFSNWTNLALVYDPLSSTKPAERTQFPNNIIPKSRINPIFDNIQKMYPDPNQKSPTDVNNLAGTYFKSGTMSMNRNNWDAKINYNATDKLVIWGKYSRMDAPVHGVPVFGDQLMGPVLGTAGVGNTHVQIPTVGFTYTFSPTFLFDGVFGYTRMDLAVLGQDTGKNIGLDVFKIPGTNGGTQFANDKNYSGTPRLNFSTFTYWGNGDTWVPVTRNDRSVAYATNFTKIHRAHEIRFGFEPRHHAMNHWQPETANPRGRIDFATGATMLEGFTGAKGGGTQVGNYAAALLGLVGSYEKSIQNFLMTTREWQFAWYVRDRWQATRNFTIDAGLRYEYYPLMTRDGRGLERWNPYTNVVTLGGIGGIPNNNGMYTSKKLFAPRLGLAYRIGDSYVIRSGYGITYNPLPFSRPLRGLYPATLTGGWGSGSPGAAFRDNLYGWYNTLDQGIPPVPVPDISTGTLTLPVDLDMGPRSPWGGMLHRGYIQSWNFTFERKLPFDAVGSLAYVGTRTIRQMLDRNINTDGPGEDVNTSNRALAKLYARTNAANMWDGIGYGSYNGLQATLNKSFSKGVLARASYSFGRYMNMAEEDGWAGLAMWDWEPMIARNYAPSNEDRRHMFTMAWVYDLPFGQGRQHNLSGVTDKVLGGWSINGYFAAYTGTPFNVTGSALSLRCYGCSQTADLIAPVKKLGGKGPGQYYYDLMSFMDPLVYFNATGKTNFRPGTMGRNVLYGPGYWRLNPALYKVFNITERVKMQFRAEAQNFTNTPAWNNPGTNSVTNSGNPTRNPDGSIVQRPDGSLRTNGFMEITGATTDRRFMFGLRATF